MREEWKEELQYEDAKVAILNLWKWKNVIITCALIGAVLGILFLEVMNRDTYYSARASVYNVGYETNFQTSSAMMIMERYASVIKSRKLCERGAAMINKPGIEYWTIQRMIYSDYNETSGILSIYAETTTDPELAVQVVNAMAQVLCEETNTVLEGDSFRILDTASRASEYKKYSTMKYLGLFVFAGIAIPCAIIFVGTFFSDKVRSYKQCVGEEDKILGVIPVIEEDE